MSTDNESASPQRVVDGDGRSWDLVDWTPGAPHQYRPCNDHDGQTVTLTELNLRGGQVRTVAPMSSADQDFLTRVLTRLAETRPTLLIPTVMAAIYDANRMAGPRNPLTSGRPGSWESAVLTAIAYSAGKHVLEGDPGDYDEPAMENLAGIIVSWAARPGRVVEVAENLASILGPIIDAAGGWTAVIPDDFHADPHAEAIQAWATSRCTETADQKDNHL